jgi:hypothetical protein
LQPFGFTIKKIFNFEAPTTDGCKEALGFINSGLRFLFYNGHGVENGWAYPRANGQIDDNEMWAYKDGTGFTLDYFGPITNTTYPFVLSCSCLTGSFWDVFKAGCWAEVWIGEKNLATAYVGSSQLSYFNQHGLHRGTAAAVTKKNITKFGLAKDFGIIYTKDTLSAYYTRGAEEYHFFGDPAVETKKMETAIVMHGLRDHSSGYSFFSQINGNAGHKNRVTFTLLSNNYQIKELTVYNLSGKTVFKNIAVASNKVVWDLKGKNNVGAGTYLTIVNIGDKIICSNKQIKKLITISK